MTRKSFTKNMRGDIMVIQMEPSRLLICELNQHQVVYLREKHGKREMPIVIGLSEAMAIDRRMRRLPSKRPLTHDLMLAVIEQLGGNAIRVDIDRVEEMTFYAKLTLEQDGKMNVIDARPSDAIALALTPPVPLPIFVSEDVLSKSITLDIPK
ncbi:MAG: bifunctional nuclease family protein [Planctomycetia bacterium]|nr:bifunctional nuclease family protein [Planctomycetia bacterium]